MSEPVTRSGFVGLAGRPNVGKSTLANAIVGTKVAIVSDRPQTTRRAVRGIATDLKAGRQMVLIDLPGVQKPRDSLTRRMQHRVSRELAGSDAVVFVINGEQGVGPGDRFIAKVLLESDAERRPPIICAVNKCDRLRVHGTLETLSAAAEFDVVDEVFPISARRGDGVEELKARLAELLPLGPYLYAPEETSDLPADIHLAELIREQVLRRTRQEVPHAVEVRVTAVEPIDSGVISISAEIWVESASQKGILIGKAGRMIQEIGSAARVELEREFEAKVFLDLAVKLRTAWRRDEIMLDRLGIE